MILSDRSLRQLIRNQKDFMSPPPEDSQIQPASIDLRLGSELKWTWGATQQLSRATPNSQFKWRIEPKEFFLGHTKEFVKIPTHLVGQLNGKSTLGRRGLMVHSTAGFIDPGFCGHITLELKNIGVEDIILEEGMLIAQLVLFQMTTPADRPYGHEELNSHYQMQSGATLAHLD